MMRGHLIAANPGHDGFEKYFGASPLIILVRPDGYVAFTGSDNSSCKTSEVLRHVAGPTDFIR